MSSIFDLFTTCVFDKDAHVRVLAANNVYEVARCIGPAETREKLLPWISEKVTLIDGQCLLNIAKNLRYFPKVVGDNHLLLVLIPLSIIVGADESIIRDAAVESIRNILSGCGDIPDTVDTVLLDFLRKLATSEHFSPRISACFLCGILHKIATNPKSRGDIKSIFSRLLDDPLPIVRREAVSVYPEMAAQVSWESGDDETLQAYLRQAADSYLHVCTAALEASPRLLSTILIRTNDIAPVKKIVDSIVTASRSPAWRLRVPVAKNFHLVFELVTNEALRTDLLAVLEAMLHDPETDVREEACNQLQFVLPLLQEIVIVSRIVPLFPPLMRDSNRNIRAGIIAGVCCCACVLSPANQTSIVTPILLEGLSDMAIEVKQSVVDHIERLAEDSPIVLVSIMSRLADSVNDSNWRIRKSMMAATPVIIRCHGCDAAPFLAGLLRAIQDDVHQVRQESAKHVVRVCQSSARDWIDGKLVPTVKGMLAPTVFHLVRMNGLQVCRTLLLSNIEFAEASGAWLLDSVIRFMSDRVVNLRLCACQVVASLVRRGYSSETRAWEYLLQSADGRMVAALRTASEADADAEVKRVARDAVCNTL